MPISSVGQATVVPPQIPSPSTGRSAAPPSSAGKTDEVILQQSNRSGVVPPKLDRSGVPPIQAERPSGEGIPTPEKPGAVPVPTEKGAVAAPTGRSAGAPTPANRPNVAQPASGKPNEASASINNANRVIRQIEQQNFGNNTEIIGLFLDRFF